MGRGRGGIQGDGSRDNAYRLAFPFMRGPSGLNPYQMAVQEGYTGTEEDWLASLVGEQGEAGPQGVPGVDAEGPQKAILTYANADLTWTYPTAFGVGVVPLIHLTVSTGTASTTPLYSCMIVGTPTNTSCVIRVYQIPNVITIILGLFNLATQAPSGVKIHATARTP